MKYTELLQHCRHCITFARANNIPLDGNYTKISVCVSHQEMQQLMADPDIVRLLPFMENVDYTRKQVIMGVTVMPVPALRVAGERYLLKHNNQYMMLSNIELKNTAPKADSTTTKAPVTIIKD